MPYFMPKIKIDKLQQLVTALNFVTFADVSLAHETPKQLSTEMAISCRFMECFLDKTMAMLVGQRVMPHRAGGPCPVSLRGGMLTLRSARGRVGG